MAWLDRMLVLEPLFDRLMLQTLCSIVLLAGWSGKILGSVTDEAYLLVLELGWADRIYQMCVHVLSGPLLGKVLIGVRL